jgi:glycosyltransferase involved in cell wall biosynthesis
MQVINSLVVGGAEQLLVILARHIDRTRYDLRVCSAAPLGDTPIVRELRELEIPLYSLGVGQPRVPRHVLGLAALARRQRIDVLHTHLGYGNTIGAMAGLLARRPVVATMHSVQHTVQEVRPGLGTLKVVLRSQALRWGAREIIAVAPEVHTAAIRDLGLPPGKIVDVPNGIDTEAFAHLDPAAVRERRRELLGGAAGPLAVTVGNMRAAKGHEYLVAATARTRAQLPGLRVAIVGRGGEYEPVVREAIATHNVGGQVILTGQRRDIAEIVAAADLYVLPSVLEGLPLALLEAMAAGKPVVATAVGGVPRVVQDGHNGRLVPPADADALAAAMTHLLTATDEAERLAENGRAHVRAAYGAAGWARQLESIYSRAAGVP